MKTVINTGNVFSVDWYGRQKETYNNPTRCQLFFSKDLIDGVAKASAALASVFLTKFTNTILKEQHQIVLNDKDQSFTDGKIITISDLHNHEMSAARKVDTMIGLAFHEACHCRYSDFSKMIGLSGVEAQILNILEDEGIEQAFKAIKGGYYNFIKNVKYLYFDEDFNGEFSANNDVEEFGNIFLALVRYPKFINDGAWLSQDLRNKWQEFFVTVHSVMERNGCFEVKQEQITENNVRVAKQIAKFLEEFIEKNKKENDENQGQDINQSEKGENNDTAESGKSEMDKQFEESQKDLNSMTSKMSEIEAVDVDLSKLVEEMAKEISEMKFDRENANEVVTRFCSEIDGTIFGTDKNCSRPQAFKEVYLEIKPCIKKVEKLFNIDNGKKIANIKTQYNQFGQLSSGSVVNALCGSRFVNTQYKSVEHKKSTKIAVALAVDMSGSMTKERLVKAQTYVTILSEVINKLSGCELYVYAHSDSIKTLVNNDYNVSKNNLGFIQDTQSGFNKGQNEVMAYTAIMDNVRKSTKLPVVGINFTDSLYCNMPSRIKATLDELKGKGCKMTLVTLANDDNGNKEIYGEGNYVQAADKQMMENIKELVKIIKKVMKK
jgi:hypothetical protein